MLTKTFRKKLGESAAVYDAVYDSLGGVRGLEFVLTDLHKECPKLTKKKAGVWLHNIAVFAAMAAKAAEKNVKAK